MAYTKYEKTKWVDTESPEYTADSPSVCADNLNKMEQGIYESVRRDGDKMNGVLELYRDPQLNMEAANKKYVDDTALSIKKIIPAYDLSEYSSGTKFRKIFINSATPLTLTKDFQEIVKVTPTKISGEVYFSAKFKSESYWDGYYIDFILYEDSKIIEQGSGITLKGGYSFSKNISVNVSKTYTMVAKRSEKCNDDRNPLSVIEATVSGYIVDDYEQYFNFS